MDKLSYEEVSALVAYDEDSGYLFWKSRPIELFPSLNAFRTWNTRYAGKQAFRSVNERGYLHGEIFGKGYKAHRICWLLAAGDWPEGEIDHINGIRSDNRLVNLRDVSHAENARNQKRHSHNTSGIVGVRYNPINRVWVAEIRADGDYTYLGSFQTKAEAKAVRRQAERDNGFHPNHGRA